VSILLVVSADQPILMTRREVADVLRLSLDTLDTWAREGKITSVRLPSGQRRYRRQDVEALITAGLEEAAS